MRIHRALLLVLLVSACAAPANVDPSNSPSAPGASMTASPSVAAETPRPSVDGHPLSELLPTSIKGVATKTADLDPVSRNSPRVFLKVIARLAATPNLGEVALAFTPESTVYAVRVAGSTGTEVLLAYLAERGYRADEVPPTVSIGGKQATKLGTVGGTYVYVGGDVFYYVETANDQLAADLLQLLP
jgi:hypothetical protein